MITMHWLASFEQRYKSYPDGEEAEAEADMALLKKWGVKCWLENPKAEPLVGDNGFR